MNTFALTFTLFTSLLPGCIVLGISKFDGLIAFLLANGYCDSVCPQMDLFLLMNYRSQEILVFKNSGRGFRPFKR